MNVKITGEMSIITIPDVVNLRIDETSDEYPNESKKELEYDSIHHDEVKTLDLTHVKKIEIEL